ncbi:MAG: PD-(D/E)XK nuclease family protein [Propionivibrio sp.]|jgi:ATP-dependent helicase/nuclease subunit B|uniref:PD-(D/E)XK nuclease family protein n=1 Tax=Propionivibrio sp. TaxID=2212460 RepID=UPI001B69394E|nr:PD-(D/E)XK nuclease family protein [Propionivibrio sp.]MBP7202583.1 PD-(D/E)XK nuclease family protein [Propionivibrio sp.]
MPANNDELICTVLPPGKAFFDDLADELLQRHRNLIETGDLSSLYVLVPALPMAVELKAALQRAAQRLSRPLLMPRFDTLSNWALGAPLPDVPEALPACERLVLLHEALRAKGWFDEAALWGIASEMAALFDEMTAAAVSLAEDEAMLAEQLQHAYAVRASVPLAFEARVVHELWRALGASGVPDKAAVYRLRLAGLLRQAEAAGQPQALFVLLDAPAAEALERAELDFLVSYARVQPLSVVHPAPRESASSPLMQALNAAWPQDRETPLFERAQALAQRFPSSPLADELSPRLQLVPTAGREPEALAAVAQIGAWLNAGMRRIALIAQDRLTARRVRALLEREGVLVSDETGWLLSTSRAAAAADALIETAASNAYFKDLLDLCKSPFFFAETDESERKAAVYAIESAIRAASVKTELPRIRRCLLDAEAGDAKTLGLALLDRIEAATTLLRARPAPLVRWINRLHKALEVLGALASLADDVAGRSLLDLLEKRRGELENNTAVFAFNAWRDWLNREFEAASFRDGSINSPIVITPLNAVCLRHFEAALLLGGDVRQLAPAGNGEFFNQSVRRELGLRTREDGERELRRDLELLLATVPRIAVTWQSTQNGEANLLAPELSLLSTLHQLAWGDDLHRRPLAARPEADADAVTAPQPTTLASPVAPLELIPQRVSVSGYSSLVACPYRFFARHVLGLGEMDEVSEEMGKADYGALVHRVLESFHKRHSLISALAENEALIELQSCVAEVFAPAVKENFLALGWRLRWEKRLQAYLDWQRAQEAGGWRWDVAEERVSRAVPLPDGASIELYGRIDRIDRNIDDEVGAALFDYKTQSAKVIRDRLKDDVQLPAYALMHGRAAQAAYVALDDESVVAVTSGSENKPLMVEAEGQGLRLSTVFGALRAGAQLPAHGADGVCTWCEMSGLCRRGFVG